MLPRDRTGLTEPTGPMSHPAQSQYGSTPWLESRYQESEEDPWGLSWRAIEQCRYDSVIELLKRQGLVGYTASENLAVLDVGCSTGHFTRRLATGVNGNVLGIDLSETAIRRARRSFPDISFRRASVSDSALSSDGFDLISCLEVLYYVEKAAQAEFVAALRNALRPNSRAFISSVIGGPPYFQPDELTSLLSRHFTVECLNFYGCAAWARIEGRLFNFVEQCDKARKWLARERVRMKLQSAESGGVAGQRLWRKLIRSAAKSRILTAIVTTLLATPSYVLKPLLRATLPAKAFNDLAASLSWERTHSLVIVSNE